jgi:hypothetical protein
MTLSFHETYSFNKNVSSIILFIFYQLQDGWYVDASILVEYIFKMQIPLSIVIHQVRKKKAYNSLCIMRITKRKGL